MHLSRYFQLKPIVRWVFEVRKSRILYIPYLSLLLSTTIFNDIILQYSLRNVINISITQPCLLYARTSNIYMHGI